MTILIAARNEEANLARCLESAAPAKRILVLDSRSADRTADIAIEHGAEVLQFDYEGGYPRKRQWALNTVTFDTPWLMMLDADEVMPDALWDEVRSIVARVDGPEAYLVQKGFHFMGRRFRYGGFSHSAVFLFLTGKARFEDLGVLSDDKLDMEVHERLIVGGTIGHLQTPLIHEDFKGMEAYLSRHDAYSTWEAALRTKYLKGEGYGNETVPARLFGNTQERRRFLKKIVLRVPGEPLIWFFYHYVLHLGFLEGKPGWVASRIRMQYIADTRRKMKVLS